MAMCCHLEDLTATQVNSSSVVSLHTHIVETFIYYQISGSSMHRNEQW